MCHKSLELFRPKICGTPNSFLDFIMKGWKRFLSEVFIASYREFQGFSLFSLVAISSILAATIWHYQAPAPSDHTADAQTLDSLVALVDIRKPQGRSQQSTSRRASFQAAEKLFRFDPNVISVAEWQQLGVPRYIAERIERYRNKGGTFRTKSDLAKIYDFDPEKYTELKPYIDLPEAAADSGKSKADAPREAFRPAEKLFRFDPNVISIAEWQQLGVPEYIAERIERYRNKGGTFRTKSDLAKIYDFDPEKYTELKPYIDLPEAAADSGKSKADAPREAFRPAEKLFRFDPNVISIAEWQQLGVPEYIAERIERYRNKGGTFRTKSDLAKIYDFDPEKYTELKPYIDLPEAAADSGKSKADAPREAFRPAEKLFRFDPNVISIAEWQQLGVPEYIAERIERYRSKGGTFRTKSDLAKIYDFDPEKYTELKPYIDLPEAGTKRGSTPDKLERFDLNTADTATLKRIRGIGSGYAARIVRLREELGGFHNLKQVREEVYRFPEATFEALKKYAYVTSTPKLRKININTADIETLQAHRYLRYKQAQVIVRYRINHGAFRDAADLRKVRALPPELINKLLPYLTF